MSLKITDLKVAELRTELEKRGLDKTGVKSVLIERLRTSLKEEGVDADEYEFKSTKRKSDILNSEGGEEEEMDTSENSKENFSKKDIEDEDTPLSDEEELDDYKHKEDTESARFKTTNQSRTETAMEEDDTSENIGISEEPKEENENTESEPNKEGENSTAATENDTSDSTDAKTGKSKVLKVIGKDKVQQLPITARTLWVTGLASTSKVSDLKNLFSKHGKVTSVKIVRSTKGTQRKWYGLLTMATSKDASKCIEKLHRTEFGGHVISVERRQTAPIVKKSEAAVVKKPVQKNDTKENATKSVKDTKKAENDDEKLNDSQDEKDQSDDERETPDRRYRSYESRSHFRGRFSRGSFRRPMGGFRGRGMSFRGRGRFNSFRRPFGRSSYDRPGYRSFSSRGRFRYDYDEGRSSRSYISEREMRMKQEEEMFRHKIIVRKQKEEAYRLEREKNQLRIEREMLEREKAEMLKLERAKQRMEREQLELEREKLRRQAQTSSYPMKRPFNRRGGGPPHGWAEKRRESEYEGSSQGFHREKFSSEGKFSPYSREHTTYKKPDFMHEEFRREKMEASVSHPKFAERDERREVTYHGGPERRVYSRNEFRAPGPSTSPPLKHFVPRSKPPREDWKFNDRRGGEKPGYPPRGRKMGYY